jgi:enoyl-CoA hydratase/carnithine racemase
MPVVAIRLAACDLVVATEAARFGLPEITLGAAPPNALGRGPDVLGRGLTRQLALDGSRWLSGREAWECGWVMELHPSASVVGAAVELARAAADNPRAVHAKRLCSLDAEQAYRSGPLMMPQLMASPHVEEKRREFFRG